MFERINSAEDIVQRKLGVALNMENTVLKMLEANAKESQDPQVEQLMRHHQDETRQQIENVKKAFDAFGWEPDDAMHPVMKAMATEAAAEIKMTVGDIVDNVILQGAATTEHHEIALYEGLIVNCRAMGRDDVVQLLQQNLEQEQHTLDEVRGSLQRIAPTTVHSSTKQHA
jgi:ferritin-like metal-binding protein YciE